ncbi:hypothetical protein LJC23_02235 [Desulfovibrio sp. OttesenSCG-928-I05]|nr:hypothetical protein [Desulfovibrio sp. OttesenSCG-928-I05]
MSDASRIHGQGPGFGGFDQRERPRGDVARFRKGRSVGSTVRGLFLRMENDSMAWINLEGEELLAQLPAEGPRPAPGDAVLFVVEALDPEPVLRMLPQSGRTLLASRLPIARQAAIYGMKRDELDRILRERLWSVMDQDQLAALSMDACREAFLDFLSRDAEAMEHYAHTQLWSEYLRNACASGGLLFFRHVPWLCPEASSVELAFIHSSAMPDGEPRLLAGLSLPGISEKTSSDTPGLPSAEKQTGPARKTPALPPRGRLRLNASPSGSAFFYRIFFSPRAEITMPPDLPGLLHAVGDGNARCLGIAKSPEAESELLAHVLAVCAESGTFRTRRFTKQV